MRAATCCWRWTRGCPPACATSPRRPGSTWPCPRTRCWTTSTSTAATTPASSSPTISPHPPGSLEPTACRPPSSSAASAPRCPGSRSWRSPRCAPRPPRTPPIRPPAWTRARRCWRGPTCRWCRSCRRATTPALQCSAPWRCAATRPSPRRWSFRAKSLLSRATRPSAPASAAGRPGSAGSSRWRPSTTTPSPPPPRPTARCTPSRTTWS
mmetsp:Transcript_2282/g.5824  ORF Transcript_2282/g.5824 Transcript_2282/m.5824 type:complete len:210 (+) Transcript_2282:525-1154(+)